MGYNFDLRVSEDDKMWSQAFNLASTGDYMDANKILNKVGEQYPEIWHSLGKDPERFYFLREIAFKTYHTKQKH